MDDSFDYETGHHTRYKDTLFKLPVQPGTEFEGTRWGHYMLTFSDAPVVFKEPIEHPLPPYYSHRPSDLEISVRSFRRCPHCSSRLEYLRLIDITVCAACGEYQGKGGLKYAESHPTLNCKRRKSIVTH